MHSVEDCERGSSAAWRSQILILPNSERQKVAVEVRLEQLTVVGTRDNAFRIEADASNEFVVSFEYTKASTTFDVPNLETNSSLRSIPV